MTFFADRKIHPKIHMNAQGILGGQNNLEKEQIWRTNAF